MALIADVLMHSGLFVIFLLSFFYTFIAYIQRVALYRDIRNMIDSYLQDVFLVSNDLQRKSQITAIEAYIKNASSNMKDQQNEFDYTNRKIVTNTMLIGLLPAIFAVGISIVITYYSGESLFEFIAQNLITLAFIMVSEFIIVGLFLNSFAIIDAAFIKATFISQSHETNRRQCEYISNWLKEKGLNKFAK